MKWETVSFGDAFEIQLGKMLDKVKNSGEPRPYLANRNVQWGRCDVSALETMRFTAQDREKFRVKKGDLLVCEGGEVGRTAIWDDEIEECYYQKAIHRLRPKADVHPPFALHFMRWAADRNYFAKLTSSTSIAHLTKAKLKTVAFPLPPLSEQKRIAGILDAADALRAKRRDALAQLDTLLQATFLDMFGDPVTNPKGWEVTSLEGAGVKTKVGPFGSLLHKADYISGGVPLVNPKHMVAGVIEHGGDETVSSTKADQLSDYRLQAGDLLMARRGEMGRCAIVHDVHNGWLCGTGSFYIRPPADTYVSEFLEAVLSSVPMRRHLENLSGGAIMPSLSGSQIKSLELPIPPIEIQQSFLSTIKAIRRHFDHLRKHAAELDTLFASLQQRAFAGEL